MTDRSYEAMGLTIPFLEVVREVPVADAALSGPKETADFLWPWLHDRDRERFVLVALDTRHRPFAAQLCSVGSLSASIVHPREVFRFLMLAGASAFVCGHNHPSGDPTPSPDDQSITNRLREVGKLVGIELLDHIVIAGGEFQSIVSCVRGKVTNKRARARRVWSPIERNVMESAWGERDG